jgi:DNA-binding NarL/FixJ family response regulator
VTPRIRVLIVDDDELVRAGLTMMLDGTAGIAVVGQAADGDRVPDAVAAHAPDVVLMDLRMPRVDGLTALSRLMSRPRPPAVIVLTTFDSDENVLRALRSGASGFLLKDSPPARIVEAVQRVAGGDPMLSPGITRHRIERVSEGAGARERARAALDALSPRERDVAAAVARGQTNAEIAAALFMGVPTVKGHVTQVMLKLGVTNRTQVAVLVNEAGG